MEIPTTKNINFADFFKSGRDTEDSEYIYIYKRHIFVFNFK